MTLELSRQFFENTQISVFMKIRQVGRIFMKTDRPDIRTRKFRNGNFGVLFTVQVLSPIINFFPHTSGDSSNLDKINR